MPPDDAPLSHADQLRELRPVLHASPPWPVRTGMWWVLGITVLMGALALWLMLERMGLASNDQARASCEQNSNFLESKVCSAETTSSESSWKIAVAILRVRSISNGPA